MCWVFVIVCCFLFLSLCVSFYRCVSGFCHCVMGFCHCVLLGFFVIVYCFVMFVSLCVGLFFCHCVFYCHCVLLSLCVRFFGHCVWAFCHCELFFFRHCVLGFCHCMFVFVRYHMQWVAYGIMFPTIPSVVQLVRQSFFCQHNSSSETAQQKFMKLCSCVDLHITCSRKFWFNFFPGSSAPFELKNLTIIKNITKIVCQHNSPVKLLYRISLNFCKLTGTDQ